MIKDGLRKLRFYYLRTIKWRAYTFGENMYVGLRVSLWAKQKLTIGDNFYIGKDSQIETDCDIGNNVILANRVGIVGKYDHHYQQLGVPIRLASRIRDENYAWKGLSNLTIIEDDVWIGYGAIIMSGVVIKKGTIIAAGSVLTKSTEAYSIYGGNPAKKIANRFNSEADLLKHIELEPSILKMNKNYKGVSGI